MFTTYAASAGSGKTTHLVADYIALCFKKDSFHLHDVLETQAISTNIFHRILAVTFTNNAAAEMKDRIVATLRDFSFLQKDAFSKRSKAIYDMVVEQLFGKQSKCDDATIFRFIHLESKELLRSIIYDYARFTLTTIDSFFQRVIRSSALILNLNLNYSVQVDLNEFYVKAIEDLLNDLQHNTDLCNRVQILLNNTMEDSGMLNIDKSLMAALKILYENAEKNFDYLAELQSKGPEHLAECIKTWRSEYSRIETTLKDTIKDPLEKIGTVFSTHSDWVTFYASSWLKNMKEDPLLYIRDLKKTGSEFYKTKMPNGDFFKAKFSDKVADAGQVKNVVESEVGKVVEAMKVATKAYRDNKIVLQQSDKLLLFSDLQDRMEKIKEQNNIFLLSESNTLIYKNIVGQDTPFLFEPIRFNNYFIDEFQDTSKMQWRDLKPLISNRALAEGGGVTVYGDVKQAIYRFRNGDVSLFHNLIDYGRMQGNEETKFGNVDEKGYRNQLLKDNYRSSQSVIRFNNDFFKFYSSKLGLADFYADVEQGVKGSDLGLVQVFVQNKEGEKSSKKYAEKENDRIEAFIKDKEDIQIAEAEVLRAVRDACERGYDLGDIAILYSGNKKCRAMANMLILNGYKVITKESLALDSSPAINLIIYTMKYLANPKDLLAQASILFFVKQLQDQSSEVSLEQILFRLKRENNFHAQMKAFKGSTIPVNEWISQPLYLLVMQILNYFGMDKNGDPFVVDFCNMVLKYGQSYNGEVSDFLAWWQLKQEEDKMSSLTFPSGVNAITISTIHKSKGLEYPVVILPYRSSSNRLSPVWVKTSNGEVAHVNLNKTNSTGSSYEDLYEEELKNIVLDKLNLLYVAHTRASDVLYVVTESQEKDQYGDYVLQYLNEVKTVESGSLQVAQDPLDERYYYIGDKTWKKKESGQAESSHSKPSAIQPAIQVKSFKVEDVASFCPVMESEQQQIGNYVHDFLSKLTDFPQTMDEAEVLVAQAQCDMQDRLRQAFEKILGDDRWKPYFAPDVKVLNEISILDEDGNEHRPDRVVFLEDEVMVLDYKTGHPRDSYQKQIDEYCNLLVQMGYENVRGELIYV